MPETQIHPTAIVDPAAQLGSGVTVGPYCIIGPGVTLGEDGSGVGLHVELGGGVGLEGADGGEEFVDLADGKDGAEVVFADAEGDFGIVGADVDGGAAGGEDAVEF